MADRKQDTRAQDEGSDSPGSKEAGREAQTTKGYDDASRPSSQADGDPGPEETKESETKESDKLQGEGRGSSPRTGTARGKDEATVHEK